MSERHEELLQRAKKEIELADHMLYVTLPMIKEVKFLLAITEHIVIAANHALEALLEYERHWKRLDAFHYSFAVEINVYRTSGVETRYNFDSKFYRLLQKLMEIQRFDKESMIRFKRGDKYILTSNEYSMSVLDSDSIKRYSNLTKKFVEQIGNIVVKPNVQAG
jgi:hypothetical protein